MNRLAHDEEGSALLIALIFLTVMAIVISASMALADTDFRNTVSTREDRKIVYAADGAIEAAVAAFRNKQIDRCDGTAISESLIPLVNGLRRKTTVICGPPMSSKIPRRTRAARFYDVTTTTTIPAFAVFTHPGVALEPGMSLVASTSTTTSTIPITRVEGSVYSNTNLAGDATATKLLATGAIRARTGCTSAYVSPDTQCTIADTTMYSAPSFHSPSFLPWPRVVVPSLCRGSTTEATLPKGLYRDVALLNAAFSTCRSVRFDPGLHVFDFRSPIINPSAAPIWTITNPNVKVDGCSTGGVELVFGGASRLQLSAGLVHLCDDGSNPAIYGLIEDVVQPLKDLDLGFSPTLAGIAIHNNPVGFNDPQNALDITDRLYALAPVTSLAPVPRSITLTGFDVSRILPRSNITDVRLEIRHKDQVTAGLPRELLLSGTASGNTATTTFNNSVCLFPCLRTEPLDHTDTIDLGFRFHLFNALQDFTVTYSAATQANALQLRSFVEFLDGVRLVIRWTPFRDVISGENGCIVPGDPSPCSLIRSSLPASLSIDGTVYAPKAALDIQAVMPRFDRPVFGRGVIARTIRSEVISAAECGHLDPTNVRICYPYQPFSPIPSTTTVVFVAVVDGRTRLRALVEFSGSSPPRVKQWSVVNDEPPP